MIKIRYIKINGKRASNQEEELLKTEIISCIKKYEEVSSFEIKVE